MPDRPFQRGMLGPGNQPPGGTGPSRRVRPGHLLRRRKGDRYRQGGGPSDEGPGDRGPDHRRHGRPVLRPGRGVHRPGRVRSLPAPAQEPGLRAGRHGHCGQGAGRPVRVRHGRRPGHVLGSRHLRQKLQAQCADRGHAAHAVRPGPGPFVLRHPAGIRVPGQTGRGTGACAPRRWRRWWKPTRS